MKNIFFLTITALISVNFYAQDVKFFELDKLYTRQKISKQKAKPFMYTIAYKTAVDSKKNTFKNPAYYKLIQELDNAKNDSIAETAEFQVVMDKYNSLLKIKQNIISYNTSSKPFEIKKKFLKEAQILANNNNIQEFLYADNTINPDRKTRFLVMSLNKFDMKVHLNKILWKLDSSIKEPLRPVFKSEAVLVDVRNRIAQTKKFKHSVKHYEKEGFILGNAVANVAAISGTFNILNSYYIVKSGTNKVLKNQLVLKSELNKKGVSSNNLVYHTPKMLIENKATKKRYLVDSNFLDRYAFTVNGKYKTSRTVSVFSN